MHWGWGCVSWVGSTAARALGSAAAAAAAGVATGWPPVCAWGIAGAGGLSKNVQQGEAEEVAAEHARLQAQ